MSLQFLSSSNLALPLLFFTNLLISRVSSAAIYENFPSTSPCTSKTPIFLHSRAVGNEFAGSDIYGIGVRLGFYLQGFAFTLNTFAKETRKGTLLATSAVVAAILASLSILIQYNNISPAETLIVIDIVQFALLPGTLAMLTIESGGQGLGIFLFTVDTLWNTRLLTWFWVDGYASLPLLETANAGFFYVQVDIDGWFRTLSLVFIAGSWIMEILFLSLGLFLIRHSMSWYFNGGRNGAPELVKFFQNAAPGLAVLFLFFTLPLLVGASERMIEWNGLSPNNDLTAPGQLIPFAVGLLGLLDSVFGVVRKFIHRGGGGDDPG